MIPVVLALPKVYILVFAPLPVMLPNDLLDACYFKQVVITVSKNLLTSYMKILNASIIVPTRNRVDDLCRMLESVIIQTEKPIEVVIVDSSDIPLSNNNKYLKTCDLVCAQNISIIYQHTKTRGAAYQRNIAMQLATGNLFHFLDDDVILESDYIFQMHEIFRKYPKYAGGGSAVRCAAPRLTWHRMLRCFFLLQRDGASGKFTFSGMPTHAYGTNNFKDVETLGAGCMCIKAEAAREIKFDELLGAYSYMEDCDFSWRISRKHKLFFNPKAVLDHKSSPVARAKITDMRAIYIRNYTYLFFKNFYSLNRLRILAYLWSILGLFVEAILLRKLEYFMGYVRGLYLYMSESIF